MKLYWKTLSALFPTKKYREEAQSEADFVYQRWDAPQGEPLKNKEGEVLRDKSGDTITDCPPDLRDKKPRLFGSEEGYNISGRVLLNDFVYGSESPVIPLLVLWYPLVNYFLGGLFPVTTAILAVAYIMMINKIIDIRNYAFWIVFSGVFGSFSLSLINEGINFKNMYMGSSTGTIPVYLINIFHYITPGVVAYLWTVKKRKTRALFLDMQANSVNAEDRYDELASHMEAREMQYERAKKEQEEGVPFVQIGTAKGITTEYMDGYSPDKGLPFGQTINDWKTHILTIGETGCGKTELIKHHATGAIESGLGVAVFDGKGQLGKELWSVYKDYNFDLIEPGYCDFAIIDLPPEQLAFTIAEVSESGKDSGGQQNPFFTNAGRKYLLTACIILEYAVRMEKEELAYDYGFKTWEELEDDYLLNQKELPLREYKKTAGYLNKICNILNNPISMYGENGNPGIIGWLQNHDDAKKEGMLTEAFDYVRNIGTMSPETFANVKSTVDAWLAPLFSNKLISETWCQQEKGVSINGPLYGKGIGVCCPPSKYSDAGTLCTQLIKAQLANAIKNRPSDWATNNSGMKQMLMIIDEAQSVITKNVEGEIIPIARSLGCAFLIATQSVDEFYSRLGKDAALAMLNNFLSFYIYRSSDETRQWTAKKLGSIKKAKFEPKMHGVPFIAAAKHLLARPSFDRNNPSIRDFDEIKRMSERRKTFLNTQDEEASTINNSGIGEFKIEIEPLLNEFDLSVHLSTPYTAMAQVMRGGVWRRDIIKVAPPLSKEELKTRMEKSQHFSIKTN